MPRNGSGTHSLTTTFVAETDALAEDVNTVLLDIAASLTGSIAIDGQSVMTGQLKAADGNAAAPGITFGSDLDSGFYRVGSNSFGVALNGALVATFSTGGITLATGKAITTPTVGPGQVPSGGIIMWSGSIVSIPTGWFLCDGTNSTPDLRSRFVVGAGSTYAVAATGGSANAIAVAHTHTGTTASNGEHTHAFNYEAQSLIAAGGAQTVADWPAAQDGTTASNGAHTHTFTTDSTGASGTNANLPPYYALAFIMKA